MGLGRALKKVVKFFKPDSSAVKKAKERFNKALNIKVTDSSEPSDIVRAIGRSLWDLVDTIRKEDKSDWEDRSLDYGLKFLYLELLKCDPQAKCEVSVAQTIVCVARAAGRKITLDSCLSKRKLTSALEVLLTKIVNYYIGNVEAECKKETEKPDLGTITSSISELGNKFGTWICKPYKSNIILEKAKTIVELYKNKIKEIAKKTVASLITKQATIKGGIKDENARNAIGDLLPMPTKMTENEPENEDLKKVQEKLNKALETKLTPQTKASDMGKKIYKSVCDLVESIIKYDKETWELTIANSGLKFLYDQMKAFGAADNYYKICICLARSVGRGRLEPYLKREKLKKAMVTMLAWTIGNWISWLGVVEMKNTTCDLHSLNHYAAGLSIKSGTKMAKAQTVDEGIKIAKGILSIYKNNEKKIAEEAIEKLIEEQATKTEVLDKSAADETIDKFLP